MSESEYYRNAPSKVAPVIAMVLFGGSAIFHTVQIVQTRARYMTALVVGAYIMTLGYTIRLISVIQPDSRIAYIGQAFFIVLAPAIYAFSITTTYTRLVTYTAKPHLSSLSPTNANRVFTLSNSLIVLLEFVGAGVPIIPNNNLVSLAQKILIVAFFIQIVSVAFFSYLCVNFQLRLWQCGLGFFGGGLWRRLLHLLLLGSVLLIVRCFYRVVEGIESVDGYLFAHEGYLYGFDAVLMFALQGLFHFWHPGSVLRGSAVEGQEGVYEGLEVGVARTGYSSGF